MLAVWLNLNPIKSAFVLPTQRLHIHKNILGFMVFDKYPLADIKIEPSDVVNVD